jgi:phosphodiesterase/alkaline phosphatase D-like protein
MLAANVSLAWNANTESDLAGYKIYWGTASRTYGTPVTLGLVTTYTVTGLTPGTTYFFAATAYDTAGNNSGYSNEVSTTIPVIDVTPPVISSILVSGVTGTGAIVAWTTNEASDTQVEYGTTTAYGSSTTLVAALVTSHNQTLTGLSPATLYHYRVKSKDAAGNLATSADGTFTTVDTVAPAPPTNVRIQ